MKNEFFVILLLTQRQRNYKSAAGLDLASYGDFPPMRLGYPPADTQPEPSATGIQRASFIYPIEPGKNVGKRLCRNTNAGIFHDDFGPALLALNRQANCPTGRGIFDRIVYQIEHQLF